MRIDRLNDEMVPAITALADRVALSKLSEESKQSGFLIPYTEAQYRDFARLAEHFYVLHDGRQAIGFVLAHHSEKIDLWDEEIYLHIKHTQTEPFVVIRQICVAPEFSGRGYGRKLYDFLFERIGKFSPSYRKAICFIWKLPPNPASEKFHRAVGWSELETYSLKNGKGVVGIWARMISIDNREIQRPDPE